jgi:hypothetical protein
MGANTWLRVMETPGSTMPLVEKTSLNAPCPSDSASGEDHGGAALSEIVVGLSAASNFFDDIASSQVPHHPCGASRRCSHTQMRARQQALMSANASSANAP